MGPRCLAVLASVLLLVPALTLVLAGCSVGATSEVLPTPTVATEAVVRVAGSGTAMPIVEALADGYVLRHPHVRFQFEDELNSAGALQSVLLGTLDLAVTNRPLTTEEAVASLEQQPFARDAIVFVTHLAHPIAGLTTSQIQGIYGGSLTDWEQLGGEPGAVIVLDRGETESSRTRALVPLMGEKSVRARTVLLMTAREMVLGLEGTPNAIGYASLGLMRRLQPQGVQIVALDGVLPDVTALANDTYPWSMEFHFVHDPDAPPEVRAFIAFVLGADGQRILDEYDLAAINE